jgi:hypothetical protein
MDIHGISFDVYTWYKRGICGISIDIPSFLKPDFAVSQCCWPHSMSVGDQECFIPRATMHATTASAPGEKAAYKRLNPTAANVPRRGLLLVAAVTAAAAAAVLQTFFCFLLRATT